MRAIVAGILCVVVIGVLAGVLEEGRLAIRDGALGKYTYRVVDDEGNVVPNARAHVWFKSYGRPQDKADWIVETDTNGMFTVEHRFNEKFSVGIEKEGYYHSHDEINYLTMSELPVKEGKWQPYGELRGVQLNRIKEPWAVKVFGEKSHRNHIPVNGEWIGFDFEIGDWTQPHGSGKYNDVLLRFKADVRKRRMDYTYIMEVSFTNNPYAGAYRMGKNRFSDLESLYQANTNFTYQTEFSFYTECIPGKPVELNYLDSNSYLVFRTRTRVDEAGNLVGAHYGKICGVWKSTSNEMLMSDGCFNLKENDPNIEGDQTLLYMIRNYKK